MFHSNPSSNLQCEECHATFAHNGPLATHQRKYCKYNKRSLKDLLAKTKEYWEHVVSPRKRRRLNPVPPVEDPVDPLNLSHVGSRQDVVPGQLLEGVTSHTLNITPDPVASQAVSGGEDTRNDGSTRDEVGTVDVDGSEEARPKRKNRKLPLRYRDVNPEPLAPLPPPQVNEMQHDTQAEGSTSAPQTNPSLKQRVSEFIRTSRNAFGLTRRYLGPTFPVHDPEEHATPKDRYDSEHEAFSNPPNPKRRGSGRTPHHPFPNKTALKLYNWWWNSPPQKSWQSFKQLLGIITDPTFSGRDVSGVDWTVIDRGMRSVADSGDEEDWVDDDDWKTTKISINVLFHNRMAVTGTKAFAAGELHHRSIVSVIREKLSNPDDAPYFHYTPFELLWQPTSHCEEIRLHGELYNSSAFLKAHEDLQGSVREPGCDLERVVVGLMFYSDSTHLTSFGTAKLWPCYLFFGNESKYRRMKPSNHLCNHIAYFETLPDCFKDFAKRHTGGKGPNPTFMAHCHREIFHAQWMVLLDDELVEAIKHGIVIECCDGVKRRFYPRIFTYSADYPEKILIATIRNGRCPCPRCLIPKSQLDEMGMKKDTKFRHNNARVDSDDRREKVQEARGSIFDGHFAITSQPVERRLQPESLVPVTNAFSARLADTDFDIFSSLVVDLMHEFELGVWKALFIHLLRILEAVDVSDNLVLELNQRYRLMPTFGRDVIRRFANNASELKKLAARDYEDLLQCAIPVFDGLLQKTDNDIIMKLLFLCAEWHGLAKLRLHTDHTLEILEGVTEQLGTQFRKFIRDTCSSYATYELKREADARARHTEKAKGTSSSARRQKKFSVVTYKYHAIGDYVDTIRKFGTSDSYSTERGESEHRAPKLWYLLMDKKKYRMQIARIERRRARLCRAYNNMQYSASQASRSPDELLGATSPDIHHHIGATQNDFKNIVAFTSNQTGREDPAIKNFISKLKHHLLPRIKDCLERKKHSSDFGFDNSSDLGPSHLSPGPSADWTSVILKHDRIYDHKIMRIKYTTYDMQRAEDIIHTGTSQSNVMVLNPNFNPESKHAHPFRYAKVLGIYHANVIYIGEHNTDYTPNQLEFLWVRWYTFVPGAGHFALDRLKFSSMTLEDSFGFLDPIEVMRACHIIPRFTQGRVHDDQVSVSAKAKDGNDWSAYYVNRFVDRDMLIRYHWGRGVGHMYAYDTSPDHKVDLPEAGEDVEAGEVCPSNCNNEQVDTPGDLQMIDIEMGEAGEGQAYEAELGDADMIFEEGEDEELGFGGREHNHGVDDEEDAMIAEAFS